MPLPHTRQDTWGAWLLFELVHSIMVILLGRSLEMRMSSSAHFSIAAPNKVYI